MRRSQVNIAILMVLVSVLAACGRGDDSSTTSTVSPTPDASVISPTPTPSVATPEVRPDSTLAPAVTPVPLKLPVLLPIIELPDVLTRVDGCEPRPRLSSGPAGGTVPWPTPTPSAEGSTAVRLAEIELSVFRGVGARVIQDATAWTAEVANDMQAAESVEDVRKLGWVLARATVPLCDAMALAPWPDKYESSIVVVENLLNDMSVWGREARVLDDAGSIEEFDKRAFGLATRSAELAETFADVEISEITTGSERLEFALPVPAGWHIVQIGVRLELVSSYGAQIALLGSASERSNPVQAGISVRSLRHVPDTDVEKWISNGELLFPGYKLESQGEQGTTRLINVIDGVRARVEILEGVEHIYYVQTICSDIDKHCLDYSDRIASVAEYR